MRVDTKDLRSTAISIGNAVRQIRLNRNLRQSEVCEAAGISRVTLSRLEKGETTTLDTLTAVLMALDSVERLGPLLAVDKPSPIQMVIREGTRRKRASKAEAVNKKQDQGLDW